MTSMGGFVEFLFLLSYMFESLHNKKLKINQYKIFLGNSTGYHVEDACDKALYTQSSPPGSSTLSAVTVHGDALPAEGKAFLPLLTLLT